MAKAVITDIKRQHLKSVKAVKYPKSVIKQKRNKAVIKEVLPFRVKFTNITVPGYGPGNVPPIGIAVIGISNYIL